VHGGLLDKNHALTLLRLEPDQQLEVAREIQERS
jgi:hypothetical protein